MGIFLQVLDPLTTGQPVALFTPQAPLPPVIPTADKILNLSRVTNCNAIPSVPAFVEVRFNLIVSIMSNLERHTHTGMGTIR